MEDGCWEPWSGVGGFLRMVRDTRMGRVTLSQRARMLHFWTGSWTMCRSLLSREGSRPHEEQALGVTGLRGSRTDGRI